jgi:outer membrane protein OmpA-like peptidoglycan-associated protein
MLRRLAPAACALALAGASADAAAQQPDLKSAPLALDRFYAAPAGDRMFGAQSPYVAGELTPFAAIYADYAHNPLVLRTVNTRQDKGSIVADQMFLHLNASLAIKSRLLINLDFPIALAQGGSNPTGPAYSFTSPSSAEAGDIRAGLRFRLLGEYWDPFQLALGGYVWFPSGSSGDGHYVGDGNVRGLPQIIVGGRVGDTLVWSFDAGPDLRSSQTFGGISQGTMIRLDGGVGFLFDAGPGTFQVGPEFLASFLADNHNGSAIERTTNLEVMLDGRYRFLHDFEVGVGVGPGLTSGIGTPDLRVVGMAAYSPEMKKEVPDKDSDGDGILDSKDACPSVKGVPNADPAKNGCPPSDSDGDGITDDKDACPTVKGIESKDPKLNGCPDTDGDGIFDQQDACPQVKGIESKDPKLNGCPDTDGDGIFDQEDACPQVPGVKNPNPKLNGCADTDGDGIFDPEDACPQVKGQPNADPKLNGCADSDGDTILDPLDACPNEKGKPDPDPKKNGCPQSVRVSETEVLILEQVQFDTNKATIKKVSDPLLDEVAGVFKEHPELTKIEVQGHTDSRGSRQLNTKLSQDRAESVVKALVKRGIAEGRMVPKGYGPDKPIGDNATDEGRQKNRRVQFVILEKVNKEGKTIQVTPQEQPPTAPPPDSKKPAPKTPDKPAPKAPAPAPKAPAPKAPAPAPKAPAPKAPAPKAPAPKKK